MGPRQNRVSLGVTGQEVRKLGPARSAFSPLGSIGMQMALSRGANGFRFGVGGVDEPARATDVFYGLALFWPSTSRALVARCSFSPVKDSGMRFAESSSAPLLSLYMRPQKLGPRRHFDARTFGGGVKFLLFRSIYFDVSDWQF